MARDRVAEITDVYANAGGVQMSYCVRVVLDEDGHVSIGMKATHFGVESAGVKTDPTQHIVMAIEPEEARYLAEALNQFAQQAAYKRADKAL